MLEFIGLVIGVLLGLAAFLICLAIIQWAEDTKTAKDTQRRLDEIE